MDIKNRTLVVGGGLGDGFTLTGPFANLNTAIDWAERVMDGPWEVVTFNDPAAYKGLPGDYVVLAGDPVGGFEVFGTFDTEAAAANWAGLDSLLHGPNGRQYSTAKLEDPNE